MRRQAPWWLIKALCVVFVFQEIIFVYEFVHDYMQGDVEKQTRELLPDHVEINAFNHPHKLPNEESTTTTRKTTRKISIKSQFAQMSNSFRVKEVNCEKIINGDWKAIKKGQSYVSEKFPQPSNLSLPSSNFAMAMQFKHSCEEFIRDSGYITHHLTEVEKNFPIAYSLIVYKHFHQVESIMRVIYRPQNYYCIHVDGSSQTHLHIAARNYADCFDNVIVSRDVIDVDWSDITSITAEMVCLYELRKFRWKYFINLSGQDYPIKTNRQIVDILTAYGGANDVLTRHRDHQGLGFKARFKAKTRPVPHNITLVRGTRYVIVSRAFVDYVTSDPRVRDFVTYLNGTRQPDETLWTSVNNDPILKAPGGFSGTLDEAANKLSYTRLRWDRNFDTGYYCHGKSQNGLCVFGIGDLRNVTKSRALFANKFYHDFEPIGLRCLREWMVNRTRDEYMGHYSLDVDHYRELPHVRLVNRP